MFVSLLQRKRKKINYLPFGGERVLVRGTGYINNYLFAGKEKDDESSLQYFEARYYSPDYGRFYSQDKVFWELGQTERGKKILSDPQSLNAYSYARNNPVIYSDPSGEFIDTIRDVGMVLYDLGRVVKNVGEIAVKGIGYGYAAFTDNNTLRNNLGTSIRSDAKELGYAGIDLGIDLAATAIPGLPAGAGLLRAGAKNGLKIAEKEILKVESQLLKDKNILETLERIDIGKGKYIEDGTIFKNKENILPLQDDLYYKEWTVETPGLNHRGKRRIVEGQNSERYYTDNHYDTFTKIK